MRSCLSSSTVQTPVLVRSDPIHRVFAGQPPECGHYGQERVESEFDRLLSENCRCPTRRHAAFTLLEVVVGLTLMASVLVGSLLSFSAHHQQQRLADAKIEAVAVADQLLDEMSGAREGIPAAGQGMIPGRPNWFWRTKVIGTATPAQLPLRVIRLQIVEVDGRRRVPLASVDVVETIE